MFQPLDLAGASSRVVQKTQHRAWHRSTLNPPWFRVVFSLQGFGFPFSGPLEVAAEKIPDGVGARCEPADAIDGNGQAGRWSQLLTSSREAFSFQPRSEASPSRPDAPPPSSSAHALRYHLRG